MDRRTFYITIFISVLLHIVVLYFIAATFGFVPGLEEEKEEVVLAVATPPPPPPPPPPPEEVVIEKPRFRPRPTPPPPTAVQVPPIPLKPQPPAESTADATTILSDKQVLDSPVSRPPIKYPQRAAEAEKEGVVRVRITIQGDGTVSDVVVVSAKPPGYFENAAIQGMKRWRFKATGRVIVVEKDVEFKLE
ncbi:MAG: energy transducer TonB [Micropepsaceae bacterium]